ncbi:hypothetical protein Drorol1_Dr00000366 [Drosera rotundifolia]
MVHSKELEFGWSTLSRKTAPKELVGVKPILVNKGYWTTWGKGYTFAASWGTVFREPIICKNIPRIVSGWNKPICIGRHAFGDQYRTTDTLLNEPGKVKLVFVPVSGGNRLELDVYDFKGHGVALAMYNVDESIRAFAKSSMSLAFAKKWPLRCEKEAMISRDLSPKHYFCQFDFSDADLRFLISWDDELKQKDKLIQGIRVDQSKVDSAFYNENPEQREKYVADNYDPNNND